MTVENIKALLDACYQAKRVRELLPVLPKGVTSSYIHDLDTIEHLEQRGVWVKVSDISDTLNIPRPGVTRTVKRSRSGILHDFGSSFRPAGVLCTAYRCCNADPGGSG